MPSSAVTGVVGTIGGTNWKRARHESTHRNTGLGLGRGRRSGVGIRFSRIEEYEYGTSRWDGDFITELNTIPSVIPRSRSRSPSH
jgi:hypothetical protein